MGLRVLDWTARSLDLNPIENLWEYKVYSRKQYSHVSELTVAIRDTWESIDENFIGTLMSTMDDRFIEVIERQGGKTHYK